MKRNFTNLDAKTMIVDLRSDTVTRPTPGMLEAMTSATTGDDVFGEDPAVNQLEEMTAAMFDMEAALYCPSGTMSNQIAINVHTRPGDEVICDQSSHVYQYEGGGIARNSGCQVKLLQGDRGRISAAQVKAAINPDDVHKANTSLVCVENTANRGGGSCYDLDELRKIKDVCLKHNLLLHLDGARFFNALIAKNHAPASYNFFDSISVCLNKGLGCPIGSMLIGREAFIRQARRVRKVLGGGMRQAGFMAACGVYALKYHIERLAIDHDHAKQVADALSGRDFVEKIIPVETNILIFEVTSELAPTHVADYLNRQGIRCLPISNTQVRMVFHLDVTRDMVERVITVVNSMSFSLLKSSAYTPAK